MKSILVFILGATLLIYAQAQQGKTPERIALTPEEMEAGRKVTQPLTEGSAMVNDLLIAAAHYRPTRNTQGDRDRLAEMGTRLVILAKEMRDAEIEYKAWLDSVRKAHACESCELIDGVLIKK